MGGQTLHIAHDSQKITSKEYPRDHHISAYVCDAGPTDREAAMAIRYGIEPQNALSYHTRHIGCTPKDPPEGLRYPVRYSVALLATCRQVHSETALLPFELNTFLFEKHWILDRFVPKLLAV